MFRASFKIQKVLDDISEHLARRGRRAEELQGEKRQQKLQRQKSGCKHPFVPVKKGSCGEEANFQPLKTRKRLRDMQDGPDAAVSVYIQAPSTQNLLGDEGESETSKKAGKDGGVTQHPNTRVGKDVGQGRRDCKEQILQPIHHLSCTYCLDFDLASFLIPIITKSRRKLRQSQSFLLVLPLGQAEQHCTRFDI